MRAAKCVVTSLLSASTCICLAVCIKSILVCMQARFAVLSAMDTYLHASPAVQRAAVRRWQPIAAIFALLWDEAMRKVALSMVSVGATQICMHDALTML